MQRIGAHGFTFHFPKAQGSLQKKEWKDYKNNSVSFGQCKTVALMSPQKLWLYAQNLYKIKPLNITRRREDGHVNPHIAVEILMADSCYGRESVFFILWLLVRQTHSSG